MSSNTPKYPPPPPPSPAGYQPQVRKPVSAAWWLAPILLAWVGGLVAYLVVKDRDPQKAKNLLIAGLVVTGVWIVLQAAAMSATGV